MNALIDADVKGLAAETESIESGAGIETENVIGTDTMLTHILEIDHGVEKGNVNEIIGNAAVKIGMLKYSLHSYNISNV